MRQPNFFIIGAPKCGTTSLDTWLSEHPAIFMAEKEPHFFNTDHQNRKIANLADYQQLFDSADDRYLAVGEASVRYLFSDDAVANILKYQPDARFIVMLRDPVELSVSWHNQLYLSGMENEIDFTTAWNLQAKRQAGQEIPKFCSESKMLQYGKVAALGWQLQRLYNQVDNERVHLIFFDDLKANPHQVYLDVLQFLEVQDDGRTDFMARNMATNYRIHFLRYIVFWLRKIKWFKALKSRLGINYKLGFLDYFQRKNTHTKKRDALNSEMRQILKEYFQDDLKLLEKTTKRNLGHWLK